MIGVGEYKLRKELKGTQQEHDKMRITKSYLPEEIAETLQTEKQMIPMLQMLTKQTTPNQTLQTLIHYAKMTPYLKIKIQQVLLMLQQQMSHCLH